jgi:NADP-dependent 3-hydroxy acid dehydrogenase YdfG
VVHDDREPEFILSARTAMTPKIALVTGVSSGIGEATARKLLGLGYTVYGAARRVDRMEKLAADGIRPIAMDVTDEDSMRSGIERILAESGRATARTARLRTCRCPRRGTSSR